MTQHTETATPIALKFKSGNGVPVESARITAEEWQAVERELAALQAKLEEKNEIIAELEDRDEAERIEHERMHTRLAEEERDTLRTQLAQTEKTRDGWLIESQEWRAKYHLERDKLAQAQNEAYQRGQNDQAKA